MGEFVVIVLGLLVALAVDEWRDELAGVEPLPEVPYGALPVTLGRSRFFSTLLVSRPRDIFT